jgi:hypothetical protein
MTRQFFILLTAATLCVSLTATAGAFANPESTNADKSNAVSQLENRTKQLEQHAWTTTGGGRQLLQLQRRHVQDLIERIKAGESVDPREIDKLLRESPQ